jgi:hypothetical protein
MYALAVEGLNRQLGITATKEKCNGMER